MTLLSHPPATAPVDSGATAWILVSAALVLLMPPALGFFYGGLVRSKSVLNTLMMSIASAAVVGVLWPIIGFSIAFSPGGRWSGGFGHAFLRGVGLETGAWGRTPHL